MRLFPQHEKGPEIPEFQTLLVKGSIHPPSVIHLCLSHISESPSEHTAIIMSPSRQSLSLALQECDDNWLTVHSGRGETSGLASRIQIFYPPSPTHLGVLLALFSTVDGNAKTLLAKPPTLLVLHDISAYFLPSIGNQNFASDFTLSSYLDVITGALGALQTDTDARSRLALFDPGLDRLQLPVLKPPRPTYIFHPVNVDGGLNTDVKPRLVPVSVTAQKFFQFVAEFTLPLINSGEWDEQEGLAHEGEHRVRLSKLAAGKEISSNEWTWRETRNPDNTMVFDWTSATDIIM